MVVGVKTLAFEDYLMMPEIHGCYDILDGELIMSPGPTPFHQWIVRNILYALHRFVRKRKLGVVLPSPVDVVIQRHPLRTRQPDILYLSTERSGIRGATEISLLQVLEIPPDLVVEVLSPSDTRRLVDSKLKDYRKIGVRECWLVSSEARTVEVLRLSAKKVETVRIYGAGDTLQSETLAGFTLSVQDIFS